MGIRYAEGYIPPQLMFSNFLVAIFTISIFSYLDLSYKQWTLHMLSISTHAPCV